MFTMAARGITKLFPAFPVELTPLQKAEAMATHHNHQYFIDKTDEDLNALKQDGMAEYILPRQPLTEEVLARHP